MTQQYLSRINAVRNHPKLGSHTPSIWTECYTDKELIEDFTRYNLKDPIEFLVHIDVVQRMRYERYLDSHSGDGPPRPCLLDGTEQEHNAYDAHLAQLRADRLADIRETYE